MLEFLGTIATIVSIVGVLFNNAMCIWCFPCWLLSNSLTAWIHYRKGVWSLLVRDLIFLVLAVAGLVQWSAKPCNENKQPSTVTVIPSNSPTGL